MTDSINRTTLGSIWEQHRDRIVAYGHALHTLLPDGDPAVTLHGRDLRPAEGVGIQFQYTLTDNLYGGEIVSACLAIQVELVRRTTSIGVRVDVAPLLEYADGHYDVFGRHGVILPLGNQRALRTFFAQALTSSATRFFNSVRAGEPIDETITTFTEPAPTP